MTQGNLHRWLVVVMLAYALGDLFSDSVSPQPCCEWMNDFAISDSSGRGFSAEDSNASRLIIATTESGQEGSPTSGPEDDCFCCCGHMLPAINFNAPLVDEQVSPAILTSSFLPAAPPQKKFHPPRLS